MWKQSKSDGAEICCVGLGFRQKGTIIISTSFKDSAAQHRSTPVSALRQRPSQSEHFQGFWLLDSFNLKRHFQVFFDSTNLKLSGSSVRQSTKILRTALKCCNNFDSSQYYKQETVQFIFPPRQTLLADQSCARLNFLFEPSGISINFLNAKSNCNNHHSLQTRCQFVVQPHKMCFAAAKNTSSVLRVCKI